MGEHDRVYIASLMIMVGAVLLVIRTERPLPCAVLFVLVTSFVRALLGGPLLYHALSAVLSFAFAYPWFWLLCRFDETWLWWVVLFGYPLLWTAIQVLVFG